MRLKRHGHWVLTAVVFVFAGLLAWPAVGVPQLQSAPTVAGDAVAVRATTLGAVGLLGSPTPSTTALSDTGTLGSAYDLRDASQTTGSIPSILAAEALNASTLGLANEVDSEASVANLGMTVGGVSISADFVMARASQVLGAAGSGSSSIVNLAIDGVPVAVTGDPNQVVWIPGGQVVINEQTISSTGTAVVNALHVAVGGVADVVVASATAGIS